MKILLDAHMLDKKETGNERYWKNLALSIKKYFPKIKVFLYGNKVVAKNKKLLRKFDGVFIPPSDNGLYRISFGFNQAIKKFKPDILHSQNFTPLIKTCPVVNTVHDLCFKYYPETFSLKTLFAFKYFFKHSLRASDSIICPSYFTKKSLIKFYSVNPKKVYVVYEAADPYFQSINNKQKVKKLLAKKFKITTKYFLVVGNIEKRKRAIEIISAFKQILKDHRNVQLIFSGPNKLNIKESKNIKILGYLKDEDLNLLYNGALALIFFSLCEGFGLPLVEAMVTKTPIIYSNIPVFKEIVGKNGICVKNQIQLVNTLKKILEDNNFRQKYSFLSKKRSSYYSLKKSVEETLKIYHCVVKNQ